MSKWDEYSSTDSLAQRRKSWTGTISASHDSSFNISTYSECKDSKNSCLHGGCKLPELEAKGEL